MNNLFPIFLKLQDIKILVVGGGYVAEEKVQAIFRNSREANVLIVAPEISYRIVELSKKHPFLRLVHEPYQSSFLEGMHLIIVATNIPSVQESVQKDAKQRDLLVNVADTPNLCDFYLSSVVQKGDLKIAISTNGKSPTFAKRLRELFEEIIPEGIVQSSLDNLNKLRKSLQDYSFEEKVKKLNKITSALKKTKKQL